MRGGKGTTTMGWYSTAQAIKGIGSVKESLNYESDKFRTLSVAISQIEERLKQALTNQTFAPNSESPTGVNAPDN
jgi:hypothetical protein